MKIFPVEEKITNVPIFQVDAFTAKPFAGNPAAVCILTQPIDAQWMQNVSREMNLSETAFLLRQEDSFQLRWFTPAVEVDLCGHATLASAHILWERGDLKPNEQARFSTRSGILTAERKGDWIEMDFPAKLAELACEPEGLAKALGVQIQYLGRNQFDYLVEVKSEEIVRSIKPDFNFLKTLPIRGVIVTSLSSSPEYDFVSRFFAPRVGVNEDPVTGSAHCCLGPFWGNRLHKKELTGYQASLRGGVVKIRLMGSRLILGGQAITVLRGELFTG
ncbi:MAG: PhzF family phenazine biosynthesis protein [Deltaproteobacteria bacterium]|nr:PhzF family phenazine biosynthesis protein [Deltaproteobacteria bacterium]